MPAQHGQLFLPVEDPASCFERFANQIVRRWLFLFIFFKFIFGPICLLKGGKVSSGSDFFLPIKMQIRSKVIENRQAMDSLLRKTLESNWLDFKRAEKTGRVLSGQFCLAFFSNEEGLFCNYNKMLVI